MKKSIQRILMSLGLLLMVSISVFFVACDVDEVDTTLSLNTNEITMVLNQDQSLNETEVVVSLSADNVSVWFNLSNNEVLSVTQKQKSGTTYIFTITALKVGECDITFVSASNSNQRATVKVNIVERVTGINFVNETDIYLTQGTKYAINANDLNVLPNAGLLNQVEYSIEANRFGLTVSKDGVIDATNVVTNCRCEITAKSKFDENIISKTYVSVISGLNLNAVEIVNTANADIIYANSEQLVGIELVKSNDLSNMLLQIKVAGYSVNDLDYSTSVSGVSLQTSVASGELYLQSINVGKSFVSLFIVPTIASKYVDPIEIKLQVQVIDLPNSILLNGVKIQENADPIAIYDYYDDGHVGTRLNFQVYPEASDNAYTDEIEIAFDDMLSANLFNFYILKNGIAVEKTLIDGVMKVESGTELYVRAKEITDLSNIYHKLKVSSIKARDYGLDVSKEVFLELKKGIQSIFVPDEIRLKVGGFSIENIEIFPQNADASQISIRTSSNKIEAVKSSALTFKVTANEVTEEEFVYFVKPNGGEVKCRVVVYESLKEVNLEIDEVVSGKVSKKEYVGDLLDSAVVKIGYEIGMKYSYNNGATITKIELTSTQSTGISLDRNKGTFTCLQPGNYIVGVTIYGYSDEGYDHSITRQVKIEAYKAIKDLRINKTSATCYTANSVGYYRSSSLSIVNLSVTADPLDARERNNVTWTLTDENGDLSSVGTLLGSSTSATYSVSSFNVDQYYVIATATIQQYGETFSASCRIKVENAIMVNQILVTNVANNNLYFDSRTSIDSKETFEIKSVIYPSSALNKNVRYEYRTLDNKISSNPILKLSADGKITPLRAGKAKVLICAEDSYTSSTEAKIFTTVYVTIQDGKSEDTAFHISTADELLDIGASAEKMSYYYQLTQNIDLSGVQNFAPIGADKKLAFTGKISGKNSFQFGNSENAEDNMVFRYYTISGINLNYEATNRIYSQKEDFVGLFYKLAPNENATYEGMPVCGTITDLSIVYDSLNVDLSLLTTFDDAMGYFRHYVGGVAGAIIRPQSVLGLDDYVSLQNVKVRYNKFAFAPGKHIAYIGGLVGAIKNSNIAFNSDCRGALVSGNDIIVLKGTDKLNSEFYIGGLVGLSENSTIKSRFNGISNSENEVRYSTSFESDNIDVTINICNSFQMENYQGAISSVNSALGGIAGIVRGGKISNCSTENLMFGRNNIGGIAGIMFGGEIENSLSASKLRGISSTSELIGENIGGIVGKITSEEVSISSTYTQSYDDGKTSVNELPQIKGNTNLGGIIGKAESKFNLEFVYSSTYITRALSDIYVGDIYSKNSNLSEVKLGGLVGNNLNAGSTINKCYTNLVLCADTSRFYSFTSGIMPQISNSYAENLIHNGTITPTAPTNQIQSATNTFFVSLLDNGTYSFIIKGTSFVEISSINLADLVVGSFAGFDITHTVNNEEMQVWNLENGVIPYLNYGAPFQLSPKKYYGLVELAPILIEANKVDSASSLMQKINGTNVLVLELNKALDNQMQSKLDVYNTLQIADYIQMQTTPQDGYTKRFIVESDNQNILRVTPNGEFKLISTGLVKVTIKSKLNINKQDVVYVQIIYATNGMNIYENQSSENSNLTSLVLYKNQEKQIYPTLITNSNQENIQTQIETGIKIEYSFDEDVSSKLKIGNENNVANYNEVHILKAIEETQKDILMQVRPYYLVKVSESNQIQLYLQDVFANKDKSYDAENIKIKILLGATNISVIQSSALLVRAGEEAETTIRVQTTLEHANEEIIYSIYDSSNMVVDKKDFIITHEKITDEQTLTASGYIDFSFKMALKGNARDITKNTAYTVRVTPESNYSISSSFTVEFYPAVIDRMEAEYFTYGFKNAEGYNKNEEARNMILPGQTGILVLDVMPFYANYDYIEVTYQQNLGLGQVYFIPNSGSTYPYAEYSNLTYLSKGIRLANISSDEKGVISFGKTGKYYITINAPTNTLLTSYGLTITAYKQGVKMEKVFSMVQTLNCINLPVIELGYRGENSKEVQEIFIPRGVQDYLDVAIYNADKEAEITILNSKTGLKYIYATIAKIDGKYQIAINQNASIGDQLRIIFECEKEIGEDTRIITQELELIVVPYLINDIGFEYVENNTMREQFGGSFRLAISFEKSSFFYDENSEEIKGMIINDLAKVNTYDYNTWYAYRSFLSGKDYSLGSYYENEYLEIKTRSNISKDLYVSGKFYDELESYQKILGAYIKYYFDKSAKCWVFNKLVKTTTNRINSNPYSFHSTKNLQNGRYYFEQSKFFNVSFYMDTSMENAKPIYNKQEFQEMQNGMSYILMRDLVLTDFTPITNQIAYLNGNNKTITIQSFASGLDVTNYGIFARIGSDAIIENLKIAISSSNLTVDLRDKSSVNFGVLTAENNGKIYNCSVSYLGNSAFSTTMITTVINGKEVRGTEEYLASLLSEEDNTSGNLIPKGSKGLILQISVVRVGEGFVSSTMGGLVGNNYGYISNCRIDQGLTIHGYGELGGLVGKNNGTIASSYSLAQVNSYSTVEDKSSIGGFVGVNRGKISLSYVEARPQTTNGSEIVTFSGINAVCIAGGFVCENSGTISNCYSNLTVTSNSSTAGFVYDNNSGEITNSYSASKVRENSKRDTAFVGVDNYNQINNADNKIIDCYFLGGNYANQDLQPAQKLSKSDFADKSKLSTFAFENKDGFSSNGVWFIPNATNGAGDYVGQTFIQNMPTLVSANLISKGYVELLNTTSSEDGSPKYNYSAIIGATLGSNSHPYVIYDSEQLNKYVAEARDNKLVNNKSYVLASNITFENNAKMAETYYTNFKGRLEGNAMVINKLRVSYLVATSEGSNDLKNIGLFRELDGATIQNVSFDVEEVYGSVVERVGTLAGTISNSKIFGIELNGNAVLQGKNLVGSLAGFVGENNEILDISSTLSVNSVYKSSTISGFNLKPNKLEQNELDYSKLSFGGGILGYVANVEADKASIIKNLKIFENAKVLGDNVGGIAGFIGENNKLENCEVLVSQGMMLKGVSSIGGIAGINLGKIQSAKVHYEQEIENALDNMDDVTANSSKSGVGTLSSLAINDFFKYEQISGIRVGIIGGIAGLNAGDGVNNGIIENSFNKVNIIDKNANVLGGIVGVNIAGKLELCYSTSFISFGYRQDSFVKFVGGIIGLISSSVNGTLNEIYSGTTNETQIINCVSISTFNHEETISYEYTAIESGHEITHNSLAIGGGVGALEQDYTLEIENLNFNKQIIASGEATTSHTAEDITLFAIGRRNTDTETNSPTYSLNTVALENDLLLEIQESNPITTNPHLYVQMVSDGKKVLDEDEKYFTFEPLANGVTGNKTEIFAPFIIENYFEFPQIPLEDGMVAESAFPNLKRVNKLYELNELFSTEGNIIYLQGSDLIKVALIANSNNEHWKKYDNFNGYILKLQTNMQLSPSFIGINTFKGTLDGNGKIISGLTIRNAEHNSFIKQGIGAYINKVQFNDVIVDINGSEQANFGLFATATNMTIDTVSINYLDFNITNANATFASFAGNLSGAYNYIVKSYVNFQKGISNINSKTASFVSNANSGATKLFIENSYSLNSNNGTKHINLTLMPNNQIKANNVVVQNNTTSESQIGQSGELISGSSCNYLYNKNSGNLKTLFETESNWMNGGQETNVWLESVWKFNSAGIPIHNFGVDLTTIISSIGKYDEGTHTYLISTAENLEALAQTINSGTLFNGGDGYVFKLDANINGNYYAILNESSKYFIYDYHTAPYVIYDGVKCSLTLSENEPTGSITVGAGSGSETINFNIQNLNLTPIGTDINPFRGIFDGNNKTISNIKISSFISHNNIAFGGLFAKTQDASIRDLNLENISINLNLENGTQISFAYLGLISGMSLSSSISNVNILGSNSNSNSINIIKDENANKEPQINNLFVGSISGFANIIELLYLNKEQTNAIETTFKKQNGITISNQKLGNLIGYLVRNQSYIGKNTISKFDLSNTQTTFGENVQTNRDEFNHQMKED